MHLWHNNHSENARSDEAKSLAKIIVKATVEIYSYISTTSYQYQQNTLFL